MILTSFIAFAALIITPATAGVVPEPALSKRQSVRSTFSVNFDRWPAGPYTSANAATDFGNVVGWDSDKTSISGGRLRATLEANKILQDGGTVASIKVSSGTEYEMQYTINFHSQFDWGRGGKVGFGFMLGDGASGCTKADGDGASMRIMWYTDDSGRTYLKPYLYYADMPTNCGEAFGLSYPSTGSLQRATQYNVYMRVRSNTGSNKNGRAIIKINGTTLLDIPIKWTDNDAKSAVQNIAFNTFRGGSQDYWASPSVGYIYYDDFSIKRIA